MSTSAKFLQLRGGTSRPVHENKNGAEGSIAIVLVTYYLQDADTAFALIEDFCRRSKQHCSCAVVVDNSGAMTHDIDSSGRRRVVAGDNSAWEFSGWLSGIENVRETDAQVVVLLNDSYRRNWSLSPLSLAYLNRMYRAAINGRVAGWVDNFSHLSPPRFSRRPNSRIVFVPSVALQALAFSLHQAIELLRELTKKGQPLFSEAEQTCLDRWAASQPGRWAPGTRPHRLQRIFLEHHMFDGLTPGLLKCFPGTWLESLIYAVGRRVLRERR